MSGNGGFNFTPIDENVPGTSGAGYFQPPADPSSGPDARPAPATDPDPDNKNNKLSNPPSGHGPGDLLAELPANLQSANRRRRHSLMAPISASTNPNYYVYAMASAAGAGAVAGTPGMPGYPGHSYTAGNSAAASGSITNVGNYGKRDVGCETLDVRFVM